MSAPMIAHSSRRSMAGSTGSRESTSASSPRAWSSPPERSSGRWRSTGRSSGNGGGGDVDLAFRLNQEERRSNYFIAWHSTYEQFDRTRNDFKVGAAVADEVTAALIQPEVHKPRRRAAP